MAHGPEALKENISMLKQMASDQTVSSDPQLGHEVFLAARWTATGTNDGPFVDRDPTGKSSGYTGVNL